MKMIPVGEKDFAIVDDEDYDRLASYRWAIKSGYARASVEGRSRVMHQLLLECPSHLRRDHINRNRLDNRKSNLRIATPTQNAANANLRKDNTSGFKGVTWNKGLARWKAQVRDGGKRLFLGYFTDAAEAARAYDRRAKELFGEFAVVNFEATAD